MKEGVERTAYFKAGCELARSLQKNAALPVDAFKGVMLGEPAAGASEVSCLEWADEQEKLSNSALYSYYWKQSVNSAHTSSLITVLPPYDTFSDKAKALVDTARKSVDEFSAQFPGFSAECYLPMAIEVDAEALTAGRFPFVISATLLVIFGSIGIRYRAALIPIKWLFTIALPILFTFGCGVLVFQDGWLNWTGIPSLQSQGGLVWINPVACSFMLVGFALDYDLFIFSRIYDERKKGRFLQDRDAIVHSVVAAGPVITTADIIMALAFIGMVVQHDNPFLCQMGFTMILGVLVDTFIVRTLLVPALLQAAGKLNWWPGTMPSAAAGDQRQVFLDADTV